MSPALDQTASVEDINHVCVLDRAEAVGDDDRCAAFGNRVQCGLDQMFAFSSRSKGQYDNRLVE